jgi:hypothetical protein
LHKEYRVANCWKDRQIDNGFAEDKSGNLIKNGKRFKIDDDYVRFQINANGEEWITKYVFEIVSLPVGG